MDINENSIKLVKSPITVELENSDVMSVEKDSINNLELKKYIEVEEDD